jgi:tRNA dimethylallyltransferase
MKPKIIFLVGPTAVGKSEVAIALAKKINAEIISCDSMQIYKGMDILTSKPSLTLRKKIPHHLIDIVSPTIEYNVAKYRQKAVQKVKEIISRGKTPLFVGGTGLYMSILIDGIFKASSADKSIRQKLYEIAKKQGNKFLYEKLKRVDPQAVKIIHPHDVKRIIRALEVFETTGKPISELKRQRKGLSEKYRIKIFCLDMDRSRLYLRINRRVEKMFSQGLVKEVKKLLKERLKQTASSCIGIKELKGYFAGNYDLEEAKRLIKRNTRRYAKRQLTWFRKDKRIKWINLKGRENPNEVANRIWRELS